MEQVRVRYRRINTGDASTLEMKMDTYLSIIAEFGSFAAYLQTFISEPFTVEMI